MDSNDRFVSVAEAAKMCSIHRVTMWRWIKGGKLDAYRTSTGLYRIDKNDLALFIEKELPFLSPNSKLAPIRVLVVDDDPSILQYIENAISSFDLQIEKAGNGFEAGIKIVDFKPSIVFLDLYMPGLDGFEICRLIKSNLRYRHIKVVAITGMGDSEAESRIRGLGADYYLEKPLPKNTLSDLLELLSQECGGLSEEGVCG